MKKTLMLTVILTSLTLGNTLDSMALSPFNLDFQNDVRLGKVLKTLGIPTDTPFYSYCGDNILIVYPNFVCSFLYKEKEDATYLYSIEIVKEGINGLKIGESERKTVRKFGEPSEKTVFPNKKVVLDYYFDGKITKHTVSLEFIDKELKKIVITKMM